MRSRTVREPSHRPTVPLSRVPRPVVRARRRAPTHATLDFIGSIYVQIMDHHDDPHADQGIVADGVPLAEAAIAVVLVHGRGATADGMLALADALGRNDVAYLAPQAAGRTWYPHSFLAPLRQNEPYLTSALGAVGRAMEQAFAGGIPRERTVILGFSQGACLGTEYAARHARRYGGVVALSGGLIGARDGARRPPEDKDFDYFGNLAGTPVFIGCSDTDPHIPIERVHKTAAVMQTLGADVDLRIYPGMGHTVSDDEVSAVRALLDRLVEA